MSLSRKSVKGSGRLSGEVREACVPLDTLILVSNRVCVCVFVPYFPRGGSSTNTAPITFDIVTDKIIPITRIPFQNYVKYNY